MGGSPLVGRGGHAQDVPYAIQTSVPCRLTEREGLNMTGVLCGIARFCVRHRFVVFGVWVLAGTPLVSVSQRLGDDTTDNPSLPGTDSQTATGALQTSFPVNPLTSYGAS